MSTENDNLHEEAVTEEEQDPTFEDLAGEDQQQDGDQPEKPESQEQPEDNEQPEDEEEQSEDDDIPEKFKGKSAAEIAKSYVKLESTIESRALAKARQMAQATTEGKAKALEEIMKEFEQADFEKMTPKEFAKFIVGSFDKLTLRRAQEVFERNTSTRQAVATEVREARQKHPDLETNQDYREYVIGQLELAEARKQKMSLIEACQKADKVFKKAGKTSVPAATQNKKPNPRVERPTTVTPSRDMGDSERVSAGILGSKSTSILGGLGI